MMRDYLYRSYLAEGEKIQFVIHRHIALELKNFFIVFFFGIFLPVFGWWLFPKIALLAAAWLAVGILRFVYEFLDWYYDAWLVTDTGIVEVMWKGFFDKSSARIEYHTVQGIGYEVKGFSQTLLNFGMIALEKFAGNPSVFDGAVNPKRKAEMLTRAQENFVTNKSFRDHQALQGILTDMLQRHIVEHGVPDEKKD